jgi:hypothetical protein
MASFLARLFMGFLFPELGLSQDPGLIVIGKVRLLNLLFNRNCTNEDMV